MPHLHPEQLFLLQTLILVGIPYFIWENKFVKKYIPLVVVQIILGLLLGPSVLEKISPEYFEFLFPKSSIPLLQGLAFMALTLFGFMTGLHLDFEQLKGKGNGFAITSLSSVVTPLIICSIFGFSLFYYYPNFVGPKAGLISYSLSIGIVGAVTALPVLSAILKEMKFIERRLGKLCLGMATVNDGFLWILIAIDLTIAQAASGGYTEVLKIIGYSALYFAVMIKIIAPIFRNLIHKGILQHDPCHKTMVVVIVYICISALTTDFIGIHYLLGAFTAGAMIPKELSHGIMVKLERAVEVVLLPFFFMLTGLKTNFSVSDNEVWMLFIWAVIFSTIGKVLGVAIPAYFTLYNHKEKRKAIEKSLVLGSFMQSQGLMEVVVLNILLQAEILTPISFAALLLMAIFKTAMTKPSVLLIHRIFGRKEYTGEVKQINNEIIEM